MSKGGKPSNRPTPRVVVPRAEPARPRSSARTNILLVVGVALAAAVGTAYVIMSSDGGDPEPMVAIDGATTYDVTAASHTDDSVAYDQTPPVGGDHAPIWQDCGFYDAPIVTEQGVHSMEHGAVWVTYQPGLADDEVAALRDLAKEEYVLVSPWSGEDLPAPLVLSAWGVQQAFDTASDPGIAAFLEAYRVAASAPEPGAPCTGGSAGMP